MKVYVDKLPKNCAEWNCPFNYDVCRCRYKEFVDVGDRDIEYDYEKGRPKNCPIQSLADYTKQVRKEVCEEIWKEFEQRLMNKTEDIPVINVANMINSVLDQIQGVEDGRNIKTD